MRRQDQRRGAHLREVTDSLSASAAAIEHELGPSIVHCKPTFAPTIDAHRVLVIDDYEGGRLALCACLSDLGCDAFGAASDIVRRELDWCALFDVIIANDDPPWADGARVVRQLRRHAPDLPAIVMNHVVTRHDAETSETPPGVDGPSVLVQPVPLDQLARAIDRVAQRWPVG